MTRQQRPSLSSEGTTGEGPTVCEWVSVGRAGRPRVHRSARGYCNQAMMLGSGDGGATGGVWALGVAEGPLRMSGLGVCGVGQQSGTSPRSEQEVEVATQHH